MKKALISLTLIGTLGCCSGAALAATMADTGGSAATTSANAVSQQQLQQLQQQIADLQSQLTAMKQQQQAMQSSQQPSSAAQSSAMASATAAAGTRSTNNSKGMRIFGVPVVSGPSVRKPTFFDGSNLFVNFPSVLRESAYLEREADMLSAGMLGTGDGPHVILSGNLEAQAGMQWNSGLKNATNKTESAANLTNVEFDIYTTFNRWTSGYMTFAGHTAPAGSFMEATVSEPNSDLSISLVQLLFGNLNKSPLYGSLGQGYLPFGRYSYGTVNNPLTQEVGRTKARSIMVGVDPLKELGNTGLRPYGEAFVFNGTVQNESGNVFGQVNNTNSTYRLDQFGVDGGMKYNHSHFGTDLGASWMNNASDLGGINGSVYNNLANVSVNNSAATNNNHYVSNAAAPTAFDVHGDVSTTVRGTSMALVGEYLQSIGSFSAKNLRYKGQGALPRVGNAELDFGHNFFNRPFTLSFSGGWSSEAVAAGIPRDRYQAAVTVTPIQDLMFRVGYTYDKNYSLSSGQINNNAGNVVTNIGSAPIGGHSQNVIGQVDLFF